MVELMQQGLGVRCKSGWLPNTLPLWLRSRCHLRACPAHLGGQRAPLHAAAVGGSGHCAANRLVQEPEGRQVKAGGRHSSARKALPPS